MNLRTWSAIGVILLLVSCSQGTQGIFASIQREQKVKSNGGLSDGATVTHMAEFQGTGAASYYIAGGGTLFHRLTGATDWQPATISAGATYNRFMAVGSAGGNTGTLWAVANYDSTGSNKLFSSPDGVNWTAYTGLGNVTPQNLIPIRKSDGYSSDSLLLTVTDNTSGSLSGSYDQVFIITSSTVGASLAMPAITATVGTTSTTTNAYSFPITGAATDGSGYYYFINNDALYSYNGGNITRIPGNSPMPTDTSELNGHGFYGIAVLPHGTLTGVGNGTTDLQAVITSTNGTVYWGTLNSGTWTYVNQVNGIKDKYYGQTVPMGTVILENQTNPAYVWMGTRNLVTNQGAGFVSLSTAGVYALQPPSGTDSDNYNSATTSTITTVSSSTVTSLATSQILLLFKASDGSYFAGTATQGLWKWVASGATGTWSQQ